MRKYPILIIVPHGGIKIPSELEDIAAVEEFELLVSSDTFANEIFSFEKECSAVISTHISKLFMDVNRSPDDLPPKTDFGLIKKETPYGRNVFREDFFPDEIAASNMIKRYYRPFHDAIKKIMSTSEIDLIIECHTSLASGPRYSSDADLPRPLVSVTGSYDKNGTVVETAPPVYGKLLLENLRERFEREQSAAENPFQAGVKSNRGFLVSEYFQRIPWLRLDVSRSLFFNDRFFNADYMRVDQIRISEIRKKIWDSIEKTYRKIYK
ncbi:MAG: N-formylglutamate amidohydrolase [Spirochaetes bacterium]|nr:N-formylglutamate amidohydrolase [Spirochaetota bacterium]